MIFAILIAVALLGIAYYHYVQGAFTALISAFSALIATLIAFGYYEPLFGMFPEGKMVNYAPGMLLVGLFALSYLVLRIVFDAFAPGNIRLPAVADKSLAAIFGLIAGMFASGVLAIGGQYFPFGPTIGGFARYDVDNRTLTVPGAAATDRNIDIDSHIDDELKENSLNPETANALLVPSDSFVTSVVTMASDGAFSGAKRFSTVHPDLLTELFANRVGAEVQTGRVVNHQAHPAATLTGVYTVPTTLKAGDAEITRLRPSQSVLMPKLSGNDVPIAVRLKFANSPMDSDGRVRLTPAGSHLQIGSRIYYPVGAIGGTGQIGFYRLDDQIIVPIQDGSDSVDLVYSIDKPTYDRIVSNDTIRDDAGYVQIKLMGRIPLSGKVTAWTPSPAVNLLQKPLAPVNAGSTPKTTP